MLICIKAAKGHNFSKIYVDMINLGNNIRLDILFKREIFFVALPVIAVFLREEKSELGPPR